MLQFLILLSRYIWKSFVSSGIRRIVADVLGKHLEKIVIKAILSIKPIPVKDISPGPIIVSGFIKENFGIGRAGNLTIQALEQAGLKVFSHDIRATLLAKSPADAPPLPKEDGGVLIMHCNAPEAVIALSRLPTEKWRNRYRIGYWAYELPIAPSQWNEISAIFHEVWVPSEFVASSLEGAKCKIVIKPHKVIATTTTEFLPKPYPSSTKHIAALGDMRSSAIRKNIFGSIAIFKEAFPSPRKDIKLIVKVSHSDADISNYNKLLDAIVNRPDIKINTDYLSEDAMDAFIKSWSLFLSPHRSEGFGLVIAEAITSNIPVLATGWSGNMDFMHGVRDMLIDFTLEKIVDDAGVYTDCHPENVWASPNIKDAARKLKHLINSPQEVEYSIKKIQANLREGNQVWEYTFLQKEVWFKLLKEENLL